METYRIQIGDCVRQLPICPINENLSIAGFVMLGDVELTEACAKELLKICPEHDIIVTAETKGITLAHEMARIGCGRLYCCQKRNQSLYAKSRVCRSKIYYYRRCTEIVFSTS